MQDFDWTAFTKRIAVKSNLETIYRAWTVPSEIERWFLEAARYTKADDREVARNESVAIGDHYAWEWFLYEVTENGKIVEANGKDTFAFTFAGECLVRVRLSEQHDYTMVELTQNNIPTDDASKRNIRLGCATGWAFYLLNLKSVYEGGLDLRNKDERLSPMVNN